MSKGVSGERRREILADWKERRPDMGVFALVCTATGDVFMGTSRDLDNAANRHLFQLETQLHPNRSLQALWNRYGRDAFAQEKIETLEYERPDEITAEDLKALLSLCLENRPQARKL